MMSASQVTPRWQAEASQSGCPRCTSSTKRYWSGGRWRWNTSFSSDELMVTVHTVFGAALASTDQAAARQASSAADVREQGIGQGRFDAACAQCSTAHVGARKGM